MAVPAFITTIIRKLLLEKGFEGKKSVEQNTLTFIAMSI